MIIPIITLHTLMDVNFVRLDIYKLDKKGTEKAYAEVGDFL